MAVNGHGAFAVSTLFGFAPTPDGDSNNPPLAKYPGSSPVITWNSGTGGLNTDAVVWILATSGYANGPSPGPAKLYAYTALPSLSGQFTQLWHDTASGPTATKFTVPTIVNGHVYVGGQKPGAACAAGSCTGRVVAWH